MLPTTSHANGSPPVWDNPMGTDGFEFIEYAAPDPVAMGALFERMGFKAIAKHRHKAVTLYRQGGINFILNAEPDSFAQRFARLHGPSICAIAFRVQDAKAAYERALNLGAWGYAGQAGPGELNFTASATAITARPGSVIVHADSARANRDLASTLPVALTYNEYPGAHEIRAAELQAAMQWLGDLAG